ncbi:hypothetical protein [Planctomyces sp. SH-PL62]|uniref:hypothetical protein n=1 Tax=Planctomyces sp. SH-PL62 TaxID=1636152 RepID=UPI00078EE044|nr:hypothetical protein [Planctomyces sp. SH-PL62]AMV41061.1 hypothetical protein VT85_26735 [Planctomyces sp. SH-PL62]
MPTSALAAIETRQARTAEAVAAKCVERWRKTGNAVEVAKRFHVTAGFVRAAVERAGAAEFHDGPATARDLDADPVDADEAEGWRTLRANGMSDAEIADEAGVNVRYVRTRIGFADAPEPQGGRRGPAVDLTPKLTPLFPVGPLTPTSECPHKGPIPAGSPFVCMVCHQSGFDAHPKVHFDPAADMPPDPLDDDTSAPQWEALASASRAAG